MGRALSPALPVFCHIFLRAKPPVALWRLLLRASQGRLLGSGGAEHLWVVAFPQLLDPPDLASLMAPSSQMGPRQVPAPSKELLRET